MKVIQLTVMMISLLSAGSFVFAEETHEDRAKSLFIEGRSLFNEEKYEEASLKFKEAYAIRPNFKLLYNIAQSEAAAKRYGQALEVFEQYLADAGDELAEERIDEVRGEIEQLKSMVGFIDVETLRGSQILIDGEHRGTAPVHGGIPVVAGKLHTVEVVANGETIPPEQVKITSGMTVVVKMMPAADGTEAIRQQPGDVTSRPRRMMIAGWVLSGTGVLCLGVGAVTGGLVLRLEKDLNPQCPDGACGPELRDDLDKQRHLAVTSTVMFAVGAAAAATGVVLLIVGKKKSERLAITPVIGAESVGVVAGVNF